jgi:predicted alpha-1,2-mannosidase
MSSSHRGARSHRAGPQARQRRVTITFMAAVMAVGFLLAAGLGAEPAGAAPAGAAASGPAFVGNPAALVNPFVGTTNGGNTFPGADVPFGMVQWSPDTTERTDGGGYYYRSPSIIGYSLTHLSGPGCAAEGDVPVLPTVGAVAKNPNATTEPLVHSDEAATPGSYQLDAGDVNTELTTTTRSGMARFTFPTTAATGNLLFKMSDSEILDLHDQFTVVNNREVAGSVTTGFFCPTSGVSPNLYTMYFDMVFDRPFASTGTWTTHGNGAYVTFDTAAKAVVEAKVGVSYVSTADAVRNRTTENPGWNFNEVRAAAEKSWQTMLGKIQVAGGTTTQQSAFYTALYHSLLEPNVFSDVNGQYMGADGKVAQVVAPQKAQYANYSGWDIYRSEIPLEAILAPRQTSDMVTSMLNVYAQTGQLPKWSENDGEAYVMVGDPADAIIADAYAFGATGFDTQEALTDMETEATVPNAIRPGLTDYLTDGYLPVDHTYGCCDYYGAVSTQEEYDTADNAIGQFAAALGDTATAQTFATRAQNWQNVFNPGSGFVQPKLSTGQFQPRFDPAVTGPAFVEADSYVYTAEVPFDVQGLIAAEGGDAGWIAYLNGLTSSVTAEGPTQIQMSDEPSFDIPWEYDDAGAPSKTEQVVRQIQDQLYTDTPGGLAGNDDLGAMSSWYVWSALGGYPENPGSAEISLGSPMFTAIAIHLANDRTITETAPAAADTAPYVQALTVNGKQWSATSLPPAIFTKGATLAWTLGTQPSATWGTAPGDAPASDTVGLLPALGYLPGTNATNVSVSPGGSATLSFGVQSMSATTQQITWTASAPSASDLGIGPSTGTVAVPSEAKAPLSAEIQVPATTSAGSYLVTLALSTTTGTALPNVVAEVDVS